MAPINISDQSANGEILGDQIVDTLVSMYEKAQRQQPQEEPHVWLGNAWLGRAEAEHEVDIHTPGMLKVALYETYLCSCVEPPLCARALGLYFLFKEQPEIVEKYPKFAKEFDELIGPVLEARTNGTIDALYRLYNPNSAEHSSGSVH